MSENARNEAEAPKAFGSIDAVLNLSPAAAEDSTYLCAALAALRLGGRCCLMGHVGIAIAQPRVMTRKLTLKGKMMDERADIIQFARLLRSSELVGVSSFCMSSDVAWETGKKPLMSLRHIPIWGRAS